MNSMSQLVTLQVVSWCMNLGKIDIEYTIQIVYSFSGIICRFTHNHSVGHFSELMGCLCYESTLNEPDGTQRILTVSHLTLYTRVIFIIRLFRLQSVTEICTVTLRLQL